MRLLKHSLLITLTFIASISLALSVQARSLQAIQDSGYINIVTTTSSPPHGFLDPETNELRGIMFEIARAIANHLGLEAHFNEVPFSGLIPSLKSGRTDLMAGPLFITDKRAEQVSFTQPVYGWGEGIVVRAGSGETFNNFKDLAGHTVGALAASVQLDMLRNLKDTDTRVYQAYNELLADLRAGRIDVALIDPPSIAYRMKVLGIHDLKFVQSYEPENQWWIGMAVQKGNQTLLDAVNNALTKMKSSGELKKILAKWDLARLAAG